MTEKRGRGRPPKDPSGRRVAKVSAYVSDEVADALRAESNARGMTISELVAMVLETHVYGDKSEAPLPPVSRDAVYAVMRVLAEEGLLKDVILGANVYPKIETNDKFAPKTSAPTSIGGANVAPKTGTRRAVDRGKGGEGT